MRVRDLGTLMVAVDAREQAVVGSKATAMLALLTIRINQRVSVDALMEAAWGDHLTPGAASTLVSHIWRLRQLLEPDRSRRQPPTVLVNDAGGYRLIGGPSSVDSLSFANATGEVGNLLAAGNEASALRQAETALALWRGQPYGVFSDAEWAQPAVARLEELRGQLQEHRVEALLATGAMDMALSDIQPLIAVMPYREHLRALQMEGLYRSGRSEEALQAYQHARRTLVEEVGIEPGIELQQLHRKILTNDPSLSCRARSTVVTTRQVEVHLPPALTPLVGRDEVVDRLSQLVGEHRLVTITGPAGCGKTRVAVEVARTVAAAFPDGVWFVDLTATSDPDLVVDVIVSTIGFAASAGATPLENLRSYLQARRVLLVLDNCEHVLDSIAEIVQLTLGDLGVRLDCCFLTTSREPISLGGELVWTLEPLGLPSGGDAPDPATAAAVELFLQRLHAVAPALGVDDQMLARVADICVAVDGLPLALELAAARAASYTLNDIAAQVTVDPSRLGRIGRGPHDHRATLRSAIEWSHQLLSPPLQLAHRRISVLPGPFTHHLAAAVIGDTAVNDTTGEAGADPTAKADVDDLLAQLVHRSLLASDGAREPGRPTAFRQLATVRSHAQHSLIEADETVLCNDRRDAWTAAHLAARPPLGSSAEVEWYRVIDDNYATVRATLARQLIEQPNALGGRLACLLYYYWYYRERMVEGTRWLQLGHDILQDGHPVDIVLARISLAAALALEGRADLARPYIAEVLAPLPGTTSERLLRIGEGLVGLTAAMWWRDEYPLVVEVHRQLTRVVDLTGSAHLKLLADAVGCEALFAQGRVEESIGRARSVQQRAGAIDNLMARWLACGPPAVAAWTAVKPADGIPWVHRCMQDHLRFGTGAGGMFIETLANFASMEGDYLRAAQLYAAAHAETRRAGMPWPRRQLSQDLITAARNYLGRTDYEQAWQDGERLTIAEIAQSG